MEDSQTIRVKAAQWMTDRGWKQLLAKKRGFEQSLFEHTDVELNALLAILPILSSSAHYNLSETEQQALIVGQIAHDVGKEIPEWQEYVKRGHGEGPWVTHIYPDLTAVVVPELVQLFNFSQDIVADACTFVDVHMKAHRTPTSMFMQLIETGKSERWQSLATIVDLLDNICSAAGLFETIGALERSLLARHLAVTYHLVQMRGVSTTLLHRAAFDSFTAKGWTPLLHFSVGTIYVAGREQQLGEPGRDQIEQALVNRLADALPKNFERVVVGSPLATLLPKPEFFDYRELPIYLNQVKRSVRRGSFVKKSGAARRKVVETYWELSGKAGVPTASDVEEQSQRIDRAQPEMLLFKFFKEAVSKPLICGEGLPIPEEIQVKLDAELARVQAIGKDKDIERAQARYAKEMVKAQDEQWQRLEEELRTQFDAEFGNGAYAALQSTSTLMPAKDLALTVDRFWPLPGDHFGLLVAHMEDALDEAREKALVGALNSIAQKLYARLDTSSRPTRASTHGMAKHFIDDLQHPNVDLDVSALGADQFKAYQRGKNDAKRPPKSTGKAQTSLLCPICNNLYLGGTTGKADFLPKPESHTNRAPAHGRAGNIVICESCKYERFLQQLLLGEKANTVLVLLPHMNVGQLTGEVIMQRAQRVRETAEELMATNSARLDERLTLQLTSVIYNKVQALDPYRLTVEELLQAITYHSRDETQKGYRKALEAKLRELTEEMPSSSSDVTSLNEMTGEEFTSWDDALDQIIAGRISSDVIDPAIREAFRLAPPLGVVCQTPNMILMPVTGSFAVGKDGETNAALRQLFILLLLGLALDCTVDIVRPGDPILFQGGEGIARVPPAPALRELVGQEWISLDQAIRWLSAIGASALLAPYTAYPERSNMYQILTADTPGHILRRIEQTGEGNVSLRQIRLIEQVKEVLHA